MNKVCSKCWQILSIDKFSKDATRSGGYSYVCKACTSIRSHSYYHLNVEERESLRYEKEYGLSPDELYAELMKQNSLCKTCGKSITLERKNAHRAHVDHSHKTGKFRGLLCRDCNLGLGNVKDNIMTLTNMIKYLEGAL